ncbi:MAG: hypothetical protein EOP84_12115 [Verrucomicrobiaceae bacterium]|nr:MAG: hypothetical protein EOP84_12115 [Verrucomicrobiaceae bacterium]
MQKERFDKNRVASAVAALVLLYLLFPFPVFIAIDAFYDGTGAPTRNFVEDPLMLPLQGLSYLVPSYGRFIEKEAELLGISFSLGTPPPP